MSLPKTFPLRSQTSPNLPIPSVGYGTWASGPNDWTHDAVLAALQAGYRHLDCAWMYGVDGAVGAAIRASGVPRHEIFVTSKFWPHFGHPDGVGLCLDKVLDGMGLGYVDLWLAHWPVVWRPRSREALEGAVAGYGVSAEEKGLWFEEEGEGKRPVVDWEHTVGNIAGRKGERGSFVPTWKAMQACVRTGKARAVGVSNFSVPELKEILPHEGEIPLSCNQVEIHPWLPQNELVEFCKRNGILVTCFSPFAGQKKDGKTLLKDEKVIGIAKKNEMDVGQLLQSWAVQRGTVPLGKSATPARIKSNLEVRKLSDEDMRALDEMEVPNGEGRSIDYSAVWDVPLFQD